MPILNRFAKALHDTVETYIVDIPDLSPEVKKMVSKAIRTAWIAGADYGIKIAGATAEGAVRGLVDGARDE